jgi:SH3-like domain-containing protein
MKYKLLVSVVSLLLLGQTSVFAAPSFMSVQVRTSPMRATPSPLGRVVATLQHADQVEIIGKQTGWLQVRGAGGQTGWMNESALTKSKIVLRAGAEDVNRAASGEELALAGKGFNSDVEADFKSKNSNIDFTWIDRMEKIVVNDQEVVGFLKEGGLN